jgi:hypothetical protein
MTWTMTMRAVAVTTACLLLGTCTAREESASRDAAGTAAGITLFENVTLIDGDTGAALERAAFLVDNSRVTAVGRLVRRTSRTCSERAVREVGFEDRFHDQPEGAAPVT